MAHRPEIVNWCMLRRSRSFLVCLTCLWRWSSSCLWDSLWKSCISSTNSWPGKESSLTSFFCVRGIHPQDTLAEISYRGWGLDVSSSSSSTATTEILVSLGTRCHQHRDYCLSDGGQRCQPSTWLSSGSVPVVGKVERFRRGSINHSLPRTERPGWDSNPEPANHSLKRQALDNLCLL